MLLGNSIGQNALQYHQILNKCPKNVRFFIKRNDRLEIMTDDGIVLLKPITKIDALCNFEEILTSKSLDNALLKEEEISSIVFVVDKITNLCETFNVFIMLLMRRQKELQATMFLK